MRTFWGFLVAVSLAVALGACTNSSPTPTVTTSAAQYPVYRFRLDVAELVDREWHAGDKLPLKWTAIEGDSTADPSIPVTLTVSLSGPAESKTEAMDQLEKGNAGIVSNAIHADSRTSNVPPSELQLPADLEAGSYSLTDSVEWPNGGEEATTTITVVK